MGRRAPAAVLAVGALVAWGAALLGAPGIVFVPLALALAIASAAIRRDTRAFVEGDWQEVGHSWGE